jgi:hypothetical protein
MVERVVRQLFDDLDGTEINEGQGETIEFALRGKQYRIDLSAQNVSKFEKALGPYLKAATPVTAVRPRTRSSNGSEANGGKRTRKTRPAKFSQSEVRAWAVENGIAVSSRGRIPADVVEAYTAAQAK